MQQNDQQKRLLIAVVLSTLAMMVWMQFTQQPVPPALDGGVVLAVDAGAVAPVAPVAQAPAAVAAADGGAAPVVEAPPAIPEKTVAFSSAAQELVFSNKGGGLAKAVVKPAGGLPPHKFVGRGHDADGKPLPVDVVRQQPGGALPGATELKGELSLPRMAMYEVQEQPGAVVFRAESAEAILEKRWVTNPEGYELRLEVTVTNKAAAAKKAVLDLVYPAWVDPKTEESGSMFSPPTEVSQALCRHAKSNERMTKEKEAKVTAFEGPARFAGFDERYFLGAFFPRFAEGAKCVLASSPTGEREARVEVDLGTLAPGQAVKREFGVYLGPKILSELQRVDLANSLGAGLTRVGEEPKSGTLTAVEPQLADSIDFGWWAVICRVLLEVMKFFQKGVVNWGIAIILLTVLVKLILYPLSVKQMSSMESIRRLQPQMDALTKKYENDKEKLNMERMRLYQENKVNPFGGCLPLLIQMPVWIALYSTLQNSFELYREPLFSFWITDLTSKDPYYILPLAMGVTMFITQKMQPTMGDPTQAKMMLYFMPVFFTFLMLSLPAGLTLYIFTNNLLSIAQQKYLQRKFALDAAKAGAKK